MRNRLVLIAALAALAVSLTACGGGTSNPAATTPTSTATSTPGSSQMKTSTPKAGELLTVADVEKVSGLSGVVAVARDPAKEARGDVNFTDAGGKLLLIGTLGDGVAYEESQSTPNYRSQITGVGDAGYVGPSASVSKTLYILAARKGDHAIILTTFFKDPAAGTTWLSMDQMKELAGLALSRWP